MFQRLSYNSKCFKLTYFNVELQIIMWGWLDPSDLVHGRDEGRVGKRRITREVGPAKTEPMYTILLHNDPKRLYKSETDKSVLQHSNR